MGLERDAPHRGIQFLEPARRTHESSAGTQHGYKMTDAALRLLPDLVAGCKIMGLPVGVVRILIGVEVLFRMLCRQIPSHADRAVGALPAIGIDNVGAVPF